MRCSAGWRLKRRLLCRRRQWCGRRRRRGRGGCRGRGRCRRGGVLITLAATSRQCAGRDRDAGWDPSTKLPPATPSARMCGLLSFACTFLLPDTIGKTLADNVSRKPADTHITAQSVTGTTRHPPARRPVQGNYVPRNGFIQSAAKRPPGQPRQRRIQCWPRDPAAVWRW